MESPLQIVFRDVSPYEELLDKEIRRWADNLGKHYSRIVSCRVAVEKSYNRHRQGNLYKATVQVKVPNKMIVVSREHPLHHSHEDIYVAVHHAFQEVARQLEEYARVKKWDVKDHDELPHGVVARLHPDGYGFITTPEGREIYFHKNSVLDGFADLEVGQEVRFEEEEGDKGPQASTVKIVHEQHLHHRKHGPTI
jgi:cold shock CspA family protein/ribosome-associated translation inhibitor RaiA